MATSQTSRGPAGHHAGGAGAGGAGDGGHEVHDFGSDDMDLGKIVLVGIVSLVIFAAGVVWAYFLMTGKERDVRGAGEARVPALIGKDEIGIVDHIPFDRDRRLEVWQAEKRKALSSYGWADRARGIARIPIEKAMEEVIAHPPDIAGQGVPPAKSIIAPPPAAPSSGRAGAGKATVPATGRTSSSGKPGPASPRAGQPSPAATPAGAPAGNNPGASEPSP